jgi:hypothetical protein
LLNGNHTRVKVIMDFMINPLEDQLSYKLIKTKLKTYE